MKIPLLLLSALSFVTMAVAEEGTGPVSPIRLAQVCDGVRDAVAITSSEEDPSTLYVGEREGAVRICTQGKLRNNDALDIEDILSPTENHGLLSIALPPDVASTKALYVSYTDKQGDTIIGRFPLRASETANDEDLAVVIKFVQPSPHNHHSTITFGPDGRLYIGLSDVPTQSGLVSLAQNRKSLFGKILRIDISDPSAYKVPSDNPFAKGDKAAPEVWSSGIQNPIQLSLDKTNQRIFFADAGRAVQEVNIAERGKSFGWRVVEGSHCVKPACSMKDHVSPIHEFSAPSGHRIVGGVVYSGRALPHLQGSYIFGETGLDQILRVHYNEGTWKREVIGTTGSPITAIGQGGDGEVYVTTKSGKVLSLSPAS